MKIKKNDTVIVIAGKDRGKTGKVLRAFPSIDHVLVEGVQIRKKHERSRRRGQKGQVVQKEFPVHISNVMMRDPKTGKGTRVGYRIEKGKKVRIAKKSGSVLG